MNVYSQKIIGLLLGVLLCLGGCSRGPDEAQARDEVASRLDTRFESGLFSVTDFTRNGSAPFRDVETGVSGIFIYYTAQLEFQAEHDLTDWSGLNLGTLSYVLGARERGVEGFRPDGNVSGDRLRVMGRLAYSEADDGSWVAIDESSLDGAGGADAESTLVAVDSDRVLADVRDLVGTSREPANASQALIVEEMGRAVDRVDLREAILQGRTTLGSGSRQGTYYAFGEALGSYAGAHLDFPLHNYSSQGSLENAGLIQSGDLDFGLVQSDVAELLYHGRRQGRLLPSRDLRAVASLWPEALHLVTLAGSGIDSVDDLQGRRVAIGVPGSGTRISVMVSGMIAADPGQRSSVSIREYGAERAVQALEAGEIDAFFLTEAVPSRALQRLARHRDDLRFVALGDERLARLSSEHAAYFPLRIEARTYPHQEQAFTTLGLAAVLMANRAVPDEKVERVLGILLDDSQELAKSYYRAAFIARDTANLAVTVPLHPAAAKFYDSYRQGEAR